MWGQNQEEDWWMIWIILSTLALAAFGVVKVFEILKYIYQHLQWIP